eukprot:gene4463-12440_t
MHSNAHSGAQAAAERNATPAPSTLAQPGRGARVCPYSNSPRASGVYPSDGVDGGEVRERHDALARSAAEAESKCAELDGAS